MTFFWLTAITASRWLCPAVWLWCWWKRPKRMVLWMVLDAVWFLATDHYDGQWARAYGLVTEFGYWLDHVGDFLFYGSVVLTVVAGSREPEAKRRGRRPGAPRPPVSPTPS